MKLSSALIQEKYSNLVNNPINSNVVVFDNDEMIGIVVSHKVCQLLGGSSLDDRTLLKGDYGRLLKASFATD